MIWHYNAFLSYEVRPVEEKRVWLDPDTANQTQVDVNAFFLQQGVPIEHKCMEQIRLAESLYANAKKMEQGSEEDEKENEQTLDRRA